MECTLGSVQDVSDEVARSEGASSEQHSAERAEALETHLLVGDTSSMVEAVDIQARAAPQPTNQVLRNGCRSRRTQASTAPVRMHPYTLDLPDLAGQRADLCLEHNLPVLEA